MDTTGLTKYSAALAQVAFETPGGLSDAGPMRVLGWVRGLAFPFEGCLVDLSMLLLLVQAEPGDDSELVVQTTRWQLEDAEGLLRECVRGLGPDFIREAEPEVVKPMATALGVQRQVTLLRLAASRGDLELSGQQELIDAIAGAVAAIHDALEAVPSGVLAPGRRDALDSAVRVLAKARGNMYELKQRSWLEPEPRPKAVVEKEEDDPTDLYVTEYDQLKAEQRDRIRARDRFVHWALVAMAGAALGVWQANALPALLLLSPIGAVLGWFNLHHDHMVGEIGTYLRTELVPLIRARRPERAKAFGWETWHRGDARRRSRRVLHLAANLGVFCVGPALALGMFVEYAPWVARSYGWAVGVDALITLVIASQLVWYTFAKRKIGASGAGEK
jgi:hypothetical protein